MFARALLVSAFALITAPALAAPVNAVASFSILGDMVARVGGDRVALTTIVGPNADTHVYEPTPTDAANVGKAQVFFVSGLGFEGWMDRLVEATGYKGQLVVASERVSSRTMDEDGETITDPHAWQSLSNGLIYVANIAKALCSVDAEGCQTYEANAKAYSDEISALDAEVKAQIASVPEAKRKVITTHDAFGYFGAAYGVTFEAPEGVSTESEASAADVAKLIEQIRGEGVSALFVENMSDGRLVEQIARETGVKLGGELYADALSTKDEGAGTYLDMFRHNVALLVPAMKGE
ncbi:metal ABC transporter substrate-binding protein [Youhaiella tibetensis]|uniref:Metal ABC transporter substrate-binding protein n=1 Tax=Paradevosia tibetensis TaxID=1447062 RepID=A0A5B9DIW0_9HYPH|nr:metal ABC transporter substrate-binding protein [Youhaiella tibetensis]QEE19007.1 metal ABC transporter substrate-binding protein [Youhaiella tibetensis]GGF37102.1 metal ABC transporter substrate-binding protein [Youhaiella tibetensis]